MSSKNTTYRADIQGLRALAVSSVILFHTSNEWLPGGFIGVDIFLVISGFLITSIILKQKEEKQFSFKCFYINRVRRIVPAYLFLLVIVTFFMVILLTPSDYKFFHDSLKSSLYFASNQYFSDFGNYFAPNANELPLLHTWSLAIEMQFYLFLPFLIVFMPSKYLKVTVGGLIVMLSLYGSYEIFVNDDKQKIYFSLIARMPEFLIGSWCALVGCRKGWDAKISNLMSTIGLVLIIVSLIFINESSPFPGVLALPACIGTALIIAARNSSINSLLSRPLLVVIGGLSYSLYLWHWPILAGFRYYFGEYELDELSIFLFLILTLLFAYISYRFIELGFSSKFQGRRAVYGVLGITLFVLCMAFTSKLINLNIVDPLEVKLTRYAPLDEICHGKIVGDCVRGSDDADSQVLVIGDSHAAQLNLFFDEVGEQNKLAMKIITASSCVTIPEFDVERLPKWARQACLDQVDIVEHLLPNYNNIIIAGMWSYHVKSQKFIEALNLFLADTREKGTNVIILSQTPMLKSNPVRLQRFIALSLPTQVHLDESSMNANDIILKISEQYENVTFVDFSETSFFKTVPFYDNGLIYLDNSHLNEVGSKQYGQFVGNRLMSFIKTDLAE
ncbi:acyltransferase family protein [Vibrio coralliilyticus]|uniref:acyltransferase family protein n=1 Tax=Vibrio coralliilyticus TaxID=190893 RepID=UPI001560309C|nr:acyltransferase family protein [Vibrio coralliilyticus]NRF63612.1 acyltransferase [Vibrio coralliilyticus]